MTSELPDLVLLKIFACLSIREQVNVRRVCKLWSQLAGECLQSRKELIISYFGFVGEPLFWHHNKQQINLSNSVIVKAKFVISDFFVKTFPNVQSLCIVYHVYLKTQIEQSLRLVNHSRLIHLQLNEVLESLRPPITLKVNFESQNLRTLFIRQAFSDLNCPQLMKLSYDGDFHMVKQKNPMFRSLEYLKVRSFSYEPGAELPGLRVLYFTENLEIIDIDDFGNLKEIHFDRSATKTFFKDPTHQDWPEEPIRQGTLVAESLNGLWNQKRWKRREDLAIFCDGFPYRNDQQFRNFVIPSFESLFFSEISFFLNYCRVMINIFISAFTRDPRTKLGG